MTLKNGKNKLIYWLAGIIIMMVGAAYGDIKSDITNEHQEAKEWRIRMETKMDDMSTKVEKSATHIEWLRDKE